MKTTSRNLIISFLLTFAMFVSLFTIAPLTAFAKEEATVPTIVSVGNIEVDQETNMGGSPSVLIGQPYSVQVIATGENLTYSAGASGYMNLPNGLSIDPETGLISGICTETEIGRHNVYIEVSNNAGKAHAVVGMWVVDNSIAPVIETEAGQLGEAICVDSFAAFKVTLANEEADYLNDLQWSLKKGSLPDGMKLFYTNNATVYIQGHPTQAGTFNFTLKVENEISSAERDFSIVVKVGTERPRIIDYNELPYAIAGKPYEYQLRASGTNTQSDPIIWSYNDTEYSKASYDLGNGLTLSNTGLISGTPTESTYLSINSIYAKNSAGFDKQGAYIIIHGNGEVSSIVVSPAETVVEKGSSFQFTAEVFGYGDVSQTIEDWANSMWYEPIGSWFPRPTSADTKIENGLLTVGEDEEREQIMVVAIAGDEKGYAMVTVVEKGAEIFAISFDANGAEGEMDTASVVENGTYKLPACKFTAPTGHEFKCWNVNGTTKAVGDEITVTENTVVKAIWQVKSFTITFDTAGGSAIAPITLNYGTVIVAPANPTKDGYTFAGWDKALPSTMPAENVTVTATWTLIPAHEHTDENGEWESDGTYHWHTCSCLEQFDKAACSGGTATCTDKAICSVCNLAYGEMLAHSHSATWQADENEHWNECACGDKANTTAHLDENDDGACDTCGYTMQTHDPDTPNTPDDSNTPDTPDTPSEEEGGFGTGAIIGIVIGLVAVIGIGGFVLFRFVIKKKALQS